MRTRPHAPFVFSSVLILCAAGAVVVLAAQSAEPKLQVLSPPEGAFVSGRVPLRAEVDPASSATSVDFFVDGRRVCSATAAPFECIWDAGATVIAHQVRVVANLVNKSRVIRVVRTKELGYTDNVEVDVVQVTATVTDHDGHYVKGLPLSAFKVFEDDKPQTITHFTSEDVPLDLIVAV